MIWTSTDIITRSLWGQKQLSIHWHAQFLKYVCDGIRELSFDTLKVVNSTVLSVNKNGMYCTLPADYVDYTLIGVPKGQFIQPMTQRNSISRLPNYNTTGQIIDYGTVTESVEPFWVGFWMYQTIDDLGENVGRLYGWNSGYTSNSYKVIKERGVIQLDERFCGGCVALEYISNGQSANSATQVDPQAQACLEAYADFKWELHQLKGNPTMIQIKTREFARNWRLLRARLADYTLEDIRNAAHRSYKLSIKN